MSPKSSTSQRKLFFQQFRDDFFHMGAILPSSSALGRAAAHYLARKEGPVRVLEAGAGTGPFTREILPCLEAGDTLDVVEINPQLMAYLKQRFAQEPAFEVKPGIDINFINADLRTIPPRSYHYVVSSLPLTNFPPTLVQEMLTFMMERLEPGGIFSYVKYIFISRFKYLFSNGGVKANMNANQAIINTFASQFQIERRAVLWNVPPTWVYYWQKPRNNEQ